MSLLIILFYCFAGVMVIAAALVLRSFLIIQKTRGYYQCFRCGYDLQGLREDLSKCCPECGLTPTHRFKLIRRTKALRVCTAVCLVFFASMSLLAVPVARGGWATFWDLMSDSVLIFYMSHAGTHGSASSISMNYWREVQDRASPAAKGNSIMVDWSNDSGRWREIHLPDRSRKRLAKQSLSMLEKSTADADRNVAALLLALSHDDPAAVVSKNNLGFAVVAKARVKLENTRNSIQCAVRLMRTSASGVGSSSNAAEYVVAVVARQHGLYFEVREPRQAESVLNVVFRKSTEGQMQEWVTSLKWTSMESGAFAAMPQKGVLSHALLPDLPPQIAPLSSLANPQVVGMGQLFGNDAFIVSGKDIYGEQLDLWITTSSYEVIRVQSTREELFLGQMIESDLAQQIVEAALSSDGVPSISEVYTGGDPDELMGKVIEAYRQGDIKRHVPR